MEEPRDEVAPQEAAPGAVDESRLDRFGRRSRHVGRYSFTALLVAALVVLIALIVANTHQVRINWVVGHSRAALVWIVVVAGVVGWVAGIATAELIRRRGRRPRT
jgi:uncharacterized integral membrane protein